MQVRAYKIWEAEVVGLECIVRYRLGRGGRWRWGKERVNSSKDNKKFIANVM